jgi:integrase
VEFAVETAMRQGEQLGLRWEDVYLARSVAILPMTKNGEGRAVPLSARAVEILRSIPRSLSGKVFPVEAKGLYSAFKSACRRAGIEDYTWHDLRHESVSRWAERGDMSIHELAAISGHKTLQMLKRYTHLHAEKLAEKMRK